MEDRRLILDSLNERLVNAEGITIERKKALLAKSAAQLSALNPLAVLSRGYAAVFDRDGGVIKDVSDLSCGDRISLKLSEGSLRATVDEVYSE